MNRSAVVVLVLIVAAGAGGYALWSQRGGEPAPGPAPDATTPVAPAAAPAVSAEPLAAPKPAAAPAGPPGYIAYPDGSFYPPLNGVKAAPKMHFHPRLAPFAKVVGKETDTNGREWYVHENGVRSTTYVNSAGVATYEIAKPVAPQLILPEEMPGGTGK